MCLSFVINTVRNNTFTQTHIKSTINVHRFIIPNSFIKFFNLRTRVIVCIYCTFSCALFMCVWWKVCYLCKYPTVNARSPLDSIINDDIMQNPLLVLKIPIESVLVPVPWVFFHPNLPHHCAHHIITDDDDDDDSIAAEHYHGIIGRFCRATSPHGHPP